MPTDTKAFIVVDCRVVDDSIASSNFYSQSSVKM